MSEPPRSLQCEVAPLEAKCLSNADRVIKIVEEIAKTSSGEYARFLVAFDESLHFLLEVGLMESEEGGSAPAAIPRRRFSSGRTSPTTPFTPFHIGNLSSVSRRCCASISNSTGSSLLSFVTVPRRAAEEFIAAITHHIPDKSLQMVRYYGWYSSRSRGERFKAGLSMPGDEPVSPEGHPEPAVLDVFGHQPRRVPSKTWRELIKKKLRRWRNPSPALSGRLVFDPARRSPFRHSGTHTEHRKSNLRRPPSRRFPRCRTVAVPAFMSPGIGTKLALTEATTPAIQKT